MNSAFFIACMRCFYALALPNGLTKKSFAQADQKRLPPHTEAA